MLGFYDYEITEEGKVLNKYNKEVKIRYRENKAPEIRLITPEGRKNFILSRIVYKVFNPEFDITDKDQCIIPKDGNKNNCHIDNLKCVWRGDLIQGDKHKVAKITNEQAEVIRQDYLSTLKDRPINQLDKKETYNSYRSLAKKYGVTYTLIKLIIGGKCRNEKEYKLKRT